MAAVAVMPTYHNAGGGYRNISAPARHTKVDNNQNHHNTTSSNVVAAQTIIENAIQSLSLIEESIHSIPSINLSGSNNILSHSVITPNMTTHSGVTSQTVSTGHLSPVTSPVIMAPSVVPNSKCSIEANAKHEVRLNAMP